MAGKNWRWVWQLVVRKDECKRAFILSGMGRSGAPKGSAGGGRSKTSESETVLKRVWMYRSKLF